MFCILCGEAAHIFAETRQTQPRDTPTILPAAHAEDCISFSAKMRYAFPSTPRALISYLLISYFGKLGVLRVTEQSTASRKATQIASEKQIASSKHEVRRRAKQSTTSSKHSTTPKQSTKSEAKHGVRSKARRLSCLLCNKLLAKKSCFPTLCPPLGGAVGGGGRRRWAYNACASPETAAACGRDCPY